MSKTRCIRIGRVWLGHYYLRATKGTPGCLWMRWVAGPMDEFQPDEFYEWEELWAAIERRCLLAGLEATAPRYGASYRKWGQGRTEKEVDIFVEVRPARNRLWKRWRRALRNRWLIRKVSDENDLPGSSGAKDMCGMPDESGGVPVDLLFEVHREAEPAGEEIARLFENGESEGAV